MRMETGLEILGGYTFEVRYSEGCRGRARVAADVAADAIDFMRPRFSGVELDIAIIVANRADWRSRQPYGLPYFNNDEDQIRPGVVVMPAGRGDFWREMGDDLRDSSPLDYPLLVSTYTDGTGGLDLQPFFDLVTIHELAHAFEVLGGLSLPTYWLSEIFANLAMHAFVATQRPQSLPILETLPTVGARSAALDARMRTEGYTTLEELQVHYTGGVDPMGPLNYVWYQYKWQRLVAQMFDEDGEEALVRFWESFRSRGADRFEGETAASLAPMLRSEVSETLGRAVQQWGQNATE